MGLGRARTAVVLLAALALASLSTVTRASPYHPFEVQSDASGGLSYAIESNLRAAQSFVPTANFTATRVAAFVEDVGKTDALTVVIVPDAAGQPNTALVLASGTNDTAPVFGWANFTLAPGLTVTAGTRYWIVADDNAGTGEGYLWRYVAADAYPRGNASTATGSAWTTQPGDFAFVVYGWTPAAVTLSVSADRTLVEGGDAVGFTIRLTNTGTEDATSVWVNATLDARLRLDGAGPGPVALAGGVVSFHPPSIPTGTTDLYLNATATAILTDNDSLALPVTAEFLAGTTSVGLAGAALLRTHAPDVLVTVGLAGATADPGAVVTFAVTVRNGGNATARHVWLNETLHPALTYLNDSASSPPVRDNQHQSWHFLDVAPGTFRFGITAQVDPQVAGDTVVANYLSVDFTDPVGDGPARGKSNTVMFRVLVPGGGGSNPWLWGSFAISATLVGGTYLVFARRRLRTEEIFLIHHSGVLLVHMSKNLKPDHDSDILSGMFTAIMNFVHDAFHFQEQQELQGLDLGRYRVHVRKGAITYLALVYTGKTTRWLRQTAARAVADVESEYGDLLKDWNGDVRGLAGVRERLKGYFLSPTGPSRPSRGFRHLAARLDATFKGMRPL